MMEEIIARGGLLTDQSLTLLNHKGWVGIAWNLGGQRSVGKNSRKREHEHMRKNG